ncbi:hypothetical protein N431DRAFT_326830 [Stipitochalara longipes BDJ]|nr:hypothetical protein N431DRAFT_326830 [Stipitochalara longipes BDJ]
MSTRDREGILVRQQETNRKSSKVTPRVTTTPQSTAEPQSFEWIPVQGDPTARRRARAHISRGIRREKALREAQAQGENKENEGSSSSSPGTRSEKGQSSATSAEGSPPHQEIDVKSAQKVIENQILRRSLGIGGGSCGDDPFQCFPVKLSLRDQAILDHYLFVYAPGSLTAESRASFQGIKNFSFESALQHPSAFHVVLALGASHIAIMTGKEDSEESIKHRWMAVKTVNERLSKKAAASDDSNIASVALLAGLELMFGCPRNYNIHMNGLTTMLELRGGFDTFRKRKPGLYATISWLDMVAACNLYSKRRFSQPRPPDASPKQAPEDKVPKSAPRLPPGYDMTKVLPDIFKGLGTVSSVINGDDFTNEARLNSSTFINETDAKLYSLKCLPDRTGNTSRRHHLNQVFPTVVLIYVTFISNHDGPTTNEFLSRFDKIFEGNAVDLGQVFVKIFQLLLAGVPFESESFTAEISSLIEACTEMDWLAMRDTKAALLDFLVHDPACEGQLQDLWKDRVT